MQFGHALGRFAGRIGQRVTAFDVDALQVDSFLRKLLVEVLGVLVQLREALVHAFQSVFELNTRLDLSHQVAFDRSAGGLQRGGCGQRGQKLRLNLGSPCGVATDQCLVGLGHLGFDFVTRQRLRAGSLKLRLSQLGQLGRQLLRTLFGNTALAQLLIQASLGDYRAFFRLSRRWLLGLSRLTGIFAISVSVTGFVICTISIVIAGRGVSIITAAIIASGRIVIRQIISVLHYLVAEVQVGGQVFQRGAREVVLDFKRHGHSLRFAGGVLSARPCAARSAALSCTSPWNRVAANWAAVRICSPCARA